MKNMLPNISEKLKDLPDKKKYLEFISAFLTIPIMATVVITNLSNLRTTKAKSVSPPEVLRAEAQAPVTIPPVEIKIQTERDFSETAGDSSGISITPSPSVVSPTGSPTAGPTVKECQKTVGPVEILRPIEGQIIAENPVCIDIDYNQTGEYCPVSWTYRIDNASWSSYTDKAICLYNMTSGNKTLELKIKSKVSNDEVSIRRNFTYQNPSATAIPSFVPSITPTNTPFITPTIIASPSGSLN